MAITGWISLSSFEGWVSRIWIRSRVLIGSRSMKMWWIKSGNSFNVGGRAESKNSSKALRLSAGDGAFRNLCSNPLYPPPPGFPMSVSSSAGCSRDCY